MLRSKWLLTPLAATLLLMAGDSPRKLSEYPARFKLGFVAVGVENLGPSVPTPAGGMFTNDYIVIEVALFAEGLGRRAAVGHPDFALRINGAATLLRPDTPGAVAASIKYPDWEYHPHGELTASAGDATVVLGRPPAVERFPGDHRVPLPAPRVENPVGRKSDQATVDELVQRAALPEGEIALPASGCLYFPYQGKRKSIKKLELVYAGPLGEGSVRIP